MKTITFSLSTINGLLFGLIFIAGLVNGSIGMPVALGFLLVTSRNLYWSQEAKVLLALLGLKVGWVGTVVLFRGTSQPASLLPLLAFDFTLLITMLIRRPNRFNAGLCISLLLLFLGDMFFNGWTVVAGSDPLGREASFRPGDFLPRLGGLFYHPFYSINISIITMLFCLIFWERWICKVAFIASIVNISINGSLRGSVLLAVFFAMMILVKRRTSFPKLLLSGTLIAAGVFYATVLSTSYLPPGSGNHFRVFAWNNALSVIQTYPFSGEGGFEAGEIYAINEETLKELGIAESFYLDLAIRYGVVPALAHLSALVFIFWTSVSNYYRKKDQAGARLNFVRAIFAGIAFVDSFYGTFMGSVLTSICFGIVQFTSRVEPEESNDQIPLHSI